MAILLALLASTSVVWAQPEDMIRQVLTDQENAWNRGDVAAFMRGYDDSPRTTFIGKTVAHGYAMILARYQRTYTSRRGRCLLSCVRKGSLRVEDHPRPHQLNRRSGTFLAAEGQNFPGAGRCDTGRRP
jgi:hypothetical protein